ncbi:MAG: DEAD/DEAH box helicase, partial [Endomicrobium sp.]|nr:DEAD/DEAH box helicase [Endomicrobium sp.]
MVKKLEQNTLNKDVIHCEGISTIVKGKSSIFLSDLENIAQVDPREIIFVKDESPNFKQSRLFIESQWRNQIPTDSKIHVGNRAAMDSMNFQLLPAHIALKNLRQRILIADTVGLGKTLEAGILISELIARGKGKRILVVTVKSMMLQFQKEMWNRFTIPLIRLDSKKIQKIKSELPSNHNPFFYYDKTIISMDTLKQTQGGKRRTSVSNVMDYRQHLENARWDIIVIDEAHNVAERGEKPGQRNNLAKLLSKHSDTLIMLSATPHDGRAKSFASLMRMLDLTAIPDVNNYKKEDVGELCIRRHKKDVKDEISGKFKERIVTKEPCTASNKEEDVFKYFVEMKLDIDLKRENRNTSNILFKTVLEKALFSSPKACIKSIEERVKKLEKLVRKDTSSDITKLNELKSLMEKVDKRSFSRYNKLLELLKSEEYNWTKSSDDRIVIFTERIETMKFLEESLSQDIGLKENEIITLSGGMSDKDQQKQVEDFGRSQSPVRILVASDVASEGINLHYLCHRLIHFDIPWSLMIFQQRNGRIDRYGQNNEPDIRYFEIKSKNDSIKGDVRILQILVEKEKMAFDNLGDKPLIGSIEEEEMLTAMAIENKKTGEEFFKELDDNTRKKIESIEMLMSSENNITSDIEIENNTTLFEDMDYLKEAISFFHNDTDGSIKDMEGANGIEVKIINDLERRLNAVMPEEAISDSYLRLSPDKQFCIDEMQLSLQNSLSELAWPKTQYLWPLHPILEWVNDKASLIYKRGEAPILGLTGKLKQNEIIYIVAGVIPNRKSIPVITDWLALQYLDGKFKDNISMEHLIERTGFGKTQISNPNKLTDKHCSMAKELVDDVIKNAKAIFKRHRDEYKNKTDEEINQEIAKLGELQKRQIDAINKDFDNSKNDHNIVNTDNITSNEPNTQNKKISKTEEA